MSFNSTHLYKFGEFVLDIEEKILKRDDKRLPLTPRAFDLLRVLVSNNGRIVEKQKLMDEVWADSFVEEGNLTFTIRQLRKIFGDDARNPMYIETVPRRGYRFIHKVENIPANDFSEVEPDASPAKIHHAADLNQSQKSKYFILAFAVLSVGVTFITWWYMQSGNRIGKLNVLSAPFSSEKLSTNGKAFHAVITPDGKDVLYVGKSSGKQSVWLRNLESSSNVEIIPATDDFYSGLAVSPDGNFLYFSRLSEKAGQLAIYRVSIHGGIPNKIVDDTQGWISVSPDGGKISFVRCFYLKNENCSLWIADSSDGKNEKKLTSRPTPFRIADNKFSPDGKSIAFAVGQSDNSANEFGLMEISVEDRIEREITKEKFFNIKGLTWMPDQSGLLITAARQQNKNFLIWQVSGDSGKARPLTNDSQTYSSLSLDKTANLLVATTIQEDFRLNHLNIENPANRKVLNDASTASFSPDGKIIFSSVMSGNEEIWSVNPDGSGQKQLTNDPADDQKPVFSTADNSIYFASNRTGEVQMWRMNADGSNVTQITKNDGGYPLLVSPDGNEIYYQHGLSKNLWRISKDGNNPEIVWEKGAYRFAVSPDAAKAAFVEKQGEGRILKIISTADQSVIETFQPAVVEYKMPEIAWMPDGKSLVYILVDENFENYSLWYQHLGGQLPQKIDDLGSEEISESSAFAVSPDGKSVIFNQGSWRHDAVLLKGLK
jgi:Tol biopolymer transport system component/DNA-binding winged helix-turn-helix (wHTH) protein